MKAIAAIVLVLIHAVISTDHTKYTDKYDNVDLEDILSSERLLAGYIKCLMDEGPCTPDGKELKNNIPDAISNDCSKCTEKQRIGSDRVLEYIIDNKPNDWVRLEQKYNSDGSYKAKYLKRKEEAERAKTEKSTTKVSEAKSINLLQDKVTPSEDD